MGQEVGGGEWSNQQRQQYREKVSQNLDVFERMLSVASFDAGDMTTGMEMELYLLDEGLHPSIRNKEVLEAIGDESFQSELAKFNLELNVDPRSIEGDELQRLERDLTAALQRADAAAGTQGCRLLAVGTCPTIMQQDFGRDSFSEARRYTALNDAIMRARGEDMFIDIHGVTGERLTMYADSIAPESACTSTQLHLQVAPHEFAAYWNAAQALAGPQVALGANSPFVCGKQLWHETRIPLYTQSADTRSIELVNQGVRPRVGFGDRWITSIFDLFEDNVRYYPALLPEVSDEDPVAVLESGAPPELAELRLHNGTIYRWNRPIYDTAGGRPHLRVENRVLPAGPSVVDVVANAAFYYGALRFLATEDRPVWTQMSFSAAKTNFRDGARDGMQARLYWPSHSSVSPDELVLRTLLPMAEEGLSTWGVGREARDRYLSVIEGRAKSRQNGATWQIETVRVLQDKGLDRADALHEMLARYLDNAASGQAVHTWALPAR
ncbi:glutamate-cysteine ligase family protein [Gephyromycinifex aptenodytis]|uniref:glutamate-cysteine ligase family protein n=1 Tax=Gephyromycinifex aptenodytis TaxID=2716227 RepID=UPI00144681FD|nr:glutamate-cysteine ligase family protein [Gephyromycinifex aptenodytis]